MGCWGAALLCAGGLGNVLERLWRGCVTDYIRFPRLPAGRLQRLVWNLADLMLSAGALLLAQNAFDTDALQTNVVPRLNLALLGLGTVGTYLTGRVRKTI